VRCTELTEVSKELQPDNLDNMVFVLVLDLALVLVLVLDLVLVLVLSFALIIFAPSIRNG
jgi:hypothetical protein